MYNIRIQLFCVLLGVSTMTFANMNDTTVIQTQQNKQGAFFIEDDGSVAYLGEQSASDTTLIAGAKVELSDTITVKKQEITFFSKEKKIEIVKDQTGVSENVKSAEQGKEHIDTTSVVTSVKDIPVLIELKNKAEDSGSDLAASLNPKTDFLVKEDKVPDRDSVILSEDEAKEKDADEDVYEGYIPLNKRTSSYKNLEEATLASDRLLAQLKRKQSQKDQSDSRSGSLSSRVIRGGDYVRTTAKSENTTAVRSNNEDFDYETDFGNEPTYYINGVHVDKSQVLKLRKKNILSRTMKLKDTASRNPNGEIWLEVKE